MELKTKDVWFVVNAEQHLAGVTLTFPSVCYTDLEDAKSNCALGECPVSVYMLLENIVKSMKKYR